MNFLFLPLGTWPSSSSCIYHPVAPLCPGTLLSPVSFCPHPVDRRQKAPPRTYLNPGLLIQHSKAERISRCPILTVAQQPSHPSSLRLQVSAAAPASLNFNDNPSASRLQRIFFPTKTMAPVSVRLRL